MDDLITPAAAEDLILGAMKRLETVTVALEDSARHVLAAPLVADRPLPPYDRVMMDGVACRAADTASSGGILTIAGLHAAGAPPPPGLPPGHCWEIMTGAALPADCDAVIPYEEVTIEAAEARITDPEGVIPGRHIHRAGSDFPAGAELVPAGRRLGSREAAVAATVGASAITIRRPPRIRILTTGDELVAPSEVPGTHQVRQSNASSLAAALAAWGPAEVRARHLPDDEELLAEAIGGAMTDADLLLLCGGISKGRRDYVRAALEVQAGPPAFHGVAQRPGKPLAFWPSPVPVFALPGNPISVLVGFHRFVLPALSAMTGVPWSRRTVVLDQPFTFAPPLAYHLPVALTDGHRALPAPLANSGDFASAIPSDGMVELPAERDEFPAGVPLPYLPWL
jgi:molybdopterin molybdotransferase